MADEKSETPDDSLASTTELGARGDWFFQLLIQLVNGADFTFGVTLTVNGVLLSGQLVGGKQYFEGIAEEFSSAFTDPQVAENIRGGISAHGKIYVNNDGSYKQESPPPTFVHLKNARVFHNSGTPIPTNRGVWWRGRIEEVSGFMLGELNADAT
jgi:hypothetical protein